MKTNRKQAEQFYTQALSCLKKAKTPFLIGGAFALKAYTGIYRDTKDLDIFCKKSDYPRILKALGSYGFRTEVTDKAWIVKAFKGEYFVDIIFAFRNQLAHVDETWFKYAVPTTILGFKLDLIPVEEMIWSKAYVQDWGRFDGADINHLLLHQGKKLDWRRLYDKMSRHWEVFFGMILNFFFVYPNERTIIPQWVIEECVKKVTTIPTKSSTQHICRGPLFTPTEYKIDVTKWRYKTHG